MPSWFFVLCVLVFAVLVWWLLPRWRYWAIFESPDTSLAYFAIFIGFVILFQQVTDYRQGFIYMLSSTNTKTIIDNSPIQPAILGVWRNIMIGFYWIFIAGIILAFIALIRGTINKAKSKDDADKIDKLIDSVNELVNEIRRDRNERNDKPDTKV